MSTKNLNKISKELFIFVFILLVLLLTAVNINTFLKPKVKVLGIETQNNSNEDFWNSFLAAHPKYIPGWIELGRMDKVKEIDPNYEVR